MNDSTNSSTQDLARRIGRLEDIEAINRLKARYVQCCDEGYDAKLFASFFSTDGVWVGPEGRYEGRKAIREFIDEVRLEMPWTFHYPIRPAIDIADDGRTASGIWYALIAQSVLNGDEQSTVTDMVNFARYEDKLVKIDGEWYFTEVQPVPSRSWDMGKAAWRS